MTAEIAVLNRGAVALAADSAVTVPSGRGVKVYNTANKLFALSKHRPVGVMFFGAAELMGVPWETIVKVFRVELGRDRCDTLRGYAERFIEFLDHGNPLFPGEQQEDWFSRSVQGYFLNIREEIDKEVQRATSGGATIAEQEIVKLARAVIRKRHDVISTKYPHLAHLPADHGASTADRYKALTSEAVSAVFQKLPLGKQAVRLLGAIAGLLFSRGIFSNNISGVVIAGFGEKEYFPSAVSFKVEGVANDRLKYQEEEGGCGAITFDDDACILAFAQNDMVHTFMEGIDASYLRWVEGYITSLLRDYPEVIAENVRELDGPAKERLREQLRNASLGLLSQFKSEMDAYRRDKHKHPVIGIVSSLPKEELAAMAESLVNLTSFKRRVSMAEETVGGPVDVAVISKGDGFVWIKRKRYFDMALNPRIMAGYISESTGGEYEDG